MVRLVSYNIHAGFDAYRRFDPEAQLAVLVSLAPDLLVLNEVDQGARRSRGMDLLSFFAAPLGMEAAFGKTLQHADGGLYGNAILSRYPILAADPLPLPTLPGEEERGALRVTVHTPSDGPLVLYGTHLGLRDDERREQAEWLASRLSAETLPCLLAGDLNQTAGSPDVSALFDRFADMMGETAGHTFPAVAPVKRIDHVLGRGFHPLCAKVVNSTASDHCPVLVSLARDD